MEIIHYISPRQTGKTHKAVELFREYKATGRRTLFVVENGESKRNISRRFNIDIKDILQGNASDGFCGRSFEVLIVDEYLGGIKNKREFLARMLPAIQPRGILIFLSTPDKKYTEEELRIKNDYLFLRSCNHGRNFINVIHTISNPEEHGFLRVDVETRRRVLRPLFNSDDLFDTEMLGLYTFDQRFEDFYKYCIPTPKKFILKDFV
jgi:hypothetical protein